MRKISLFIATCQRKTSAGLVAVRRPMLLGNAGEVAG